jgi:periplasmic copper chaperone A
MVPKKNLEEERIMKKSLRVVVLLGMLLLLVSGCGSTGPAASDAWAYAAKAGDNVGVFMVVKNLADKDDALVSAKTTVSDRAELHTMVADPKGGMMMQQVQSISVPAKGQVELKKGSLHVMVFGLNKALVAGDTFPVTLHTQSGKDITVKVTVKPQA